LKNNFTSLKKVIYAFLKNTNIQRTMILKPKIIFFYNMGTKKTPTFVRG